MTSQQQQQQQQWHPQIHKRVRGELFKCLDQMSTLEKNFSDAQTEITRLRQYIKVHSETNITRKDMRIVLNIELRLFDFCNTIL